MLKKKMLRYKVMEKHMELVRIGKFKQAQLLLQLLRRGKVKLYLDDISYEVEILLEELGCRFSYDCRGFTATAYL